MQHSLIPVVITVLLSCGCQAGSAERVAADRGTPDEPPPAPREFRAAWVATVSNIDWPSKPGLSTSQQQEEALAILNKAAELNLNAVVLQVRPAADALYDSRYEPWSYYLTGEQGQRPKPYYDPLKFWIEEAHKRGLELHAWFNPYRARHSGAKYATARNHVSRANPKIVREFNNWQWLDPAEQQAQNLTYNVFMDVVKRYDVDGIHIDDYFYPYAAYLKTGDKIMDFPDDGAWQRYQRTGGKLSRADWRRKNVNKLIERIYEGAKKTKRTVQFGISPFGIAQPGRPPEVKSSFNQYEELYADAELWLKQGWLDYWTPQLYWKIDSEQPYEALLKWWVKQNAHNRHVWPGNFTSRVGDREKAWPAEEIIRQIEVTREVQGATGNVHFSMKALLENRDGLSDKLKAGPYREPALVPASPWLDDKAPNAPTVRVVRERSATRLNWRAGRGEEPFAYAVWTQHGDNWRFSVHPAQSTGMELKADENGVLPGAAVVTAVDRRGNESSRVRLSLPQK